MLIRCARKHDVGLRRIGVHAVRVHADHLARGRPDDHDVRPGLHPMALVGCMGIVIAGPDVARHHVDEAGLVGRRRLAADRLAPFHCVCVRAQRRSL